MRKAIIYILTYILTFNLTAYGQEIPVPLNYSIIDSVTGDLDKDGIKELVVAYNTQQEKDFEGISRELIIYKLENNKWIE